MAHDLQIVVLRKSAIAVLASETDHAKVKFLNELQNSGWQRARIGCLSNLCGRLSL
jgi:hypothetical protein